MEEIKMERDYYVDFHRRGNNVYVSIRNKGNNGEQKGGVRLQYVVTLEDVLNNISEDYDERGTTSSC